MKAEKLSERRSHDITAVTGPFNLKLSGSAFGSFGIVDHEISQHQNQKLGVTHGQHVELHGNPSKNSSTGLADILSLEVHQC